MQTQTQGTSTAKSSSQTKPVKVAMIGASGIFFGKSITSFAKYECLRDAEIVAVDIEQDIVDAAVSKAKKINKEEGMNMTISGTLDRKEAIEGADWVITAVEKNRFDFWKQDVFIAEKHGVGQVCGENGGPAGVFHALRQLTIFQGISEDIVSLNPSVRVANLSNPMTHILMLMKNHYNIESYGICHGLLGCTGVLAETMGMEPDAIEPIAAGLNHFVWILEMHHAETGEDFYPEFKKRVRDNIFYNKLSIECMDIFGKYPVPYDSHISEYLSFAGQEGWEDHDLYSKLFQLNQADAKHKKGAEFEPDSPIALLAIEETSNKYPANPNHPRYREDDAGELIGPLVAGSKEFRPAVTVQNQGAISNLPMDAIVEVPSYLHNGHLYPLSVGELPLGIASLCQRQIDIQRLIVEGSIKGDRGLILESLLLDPHVRTIKQARGILEDGLNAYKVELPQFF